VINTLTLNPAVDKIIFLDQVKKQMTNRVRESLKTVGGKGTHVSMNLRTLGVDSRAFGLAYGSTGRYIIEQLNACGVETRFCHAPDREGRTNYLIVEDDNTCTTLAERGATPTQQELRAVLDDLRNTLNPGDYLVLSGDASNMPNSGIYRQIMDEIADKRVRVFLDGSGKMLEDGLKGHPFLIKPNRDELAALCAMQMDTDEDVVRAIKSLSFYDIEFVAVSLGRSGSIVSMPDGIFKTVAPDVPVRNTIGCGDCFLSGLLYGFQKGLCPREMLVLATAISSATAASPLSVGFDLAYAKDLMKDCVVEQIG